MKEHTDFNKDIAALNKQIREHSATAKRSDINLEAVKAAQKKSADERER